jgi:hypothetical protein
MSSGGGLCMQMRALYRSTTNHPRIGTGTNKGLVTALLGRWACEEPVRTPAPRSTR